LVSPRKDYESNDNNVKSVLMENPVIVDAISFFPDGIGSLHRGMPS
jgi:hypothetical protein